MEFSVNGSVRSLKGNCTLSFCVSLNRNCGTRIPSSAEALPFSTRYRETGVSRGDFPGLLQD